MKQAPALSMKGGRFKTDPSPRTSRSGPTNLSNPGARLIEATTSPAFGAANMSDRQAPARAALKHCPDLIIGRSMWSLECACLPIHVVVQVDQIPRMHRLLCCDPPMAALRDRRTGRQACPAMGCTG